MKIAKLLSVIIITTHVNDVYDHKMTKSNEKLIKVHNGIPMCIHSHVNMYKASSKMLM